MKSTGVVRKIDDLGRIVIPKELRKNLRIKESDTLEIFVEGEDIILRKYSMMKKINDLAQELTDAIYTFTRHNVFITDTNTIIAASGNLKRVFIKQPISNFIVKSIQRRDKILENHFKELNIIGNEEIECSYILETILVNSESVGMIIILSEEEKLSEVEMQLACIVSSFINKYLEQ